MISPIEMLREAIKAVPSVKYALGIGGVASVVVIIYSFGLNPKVAIIGTVIILIFMGILVVFARMASISSAKMLLPAMCLTWFVLILFMLFSLSLFSSVFFKKPIDLHHWIGSTSDTESLEDIKIFPAYKFHKKILELNKLKDTERVDTEKKLVDELREFILKNPWGNNLKNSSLFKNNNSSFDIKSYLVGDNLLLVLSDSFGNEGKIFFIDIKKIY
ncbi:hypothetical protein KTH46_01060 [Acinetobacter bereziniae]|uniref:hypothetical protein n=1 Tax=Acinetobacter bereziniae TaxID=106648 RepID=UPI0021D347AE|nr:hypothetical protein [Acinetobacter bereziniae]MCU4313616.1 hypothetical protein [Acinetobacter bereziniae]